MDQVGCASLRFIGPWCVVDTAYEHPRLASIYDLMDPNRSDLAVYLALVEEVGAGAVLDVGCGTGTLALMLADRGLQVTAIDVAAGMLDVARAKPGADRVTWLHTSAAQLPPLRLNLVVMTGNVAQAIAEPADWDATLTGAYDALKPGGRLIFETRDPARHQWEEWNRPASWSTVELPGVGVVESWFDLIEVHGPLVTFRGTCVFAADGATLTSESTLRFRERDEVHAQLEERGFDVMEVRDAPDRPGRELVFIARRPTRRATGLVPDAELALKSLPTPAS